MGRRSAPYEKSAPFWTQSFLCACTGSFARAARRIVSSEKLRRSFDDRRKAPSTSPGRSDPNTRSRSARASRPCGRRDRAAASARDAAARYCAKSRRFPGRSDRRAAVRAEAGHEQLVELELLGDDVAGAEDSCQVSTGCREALDEAVADRIGRVEEDDGDVVLRSCLSRPARPESTGPQRRR